MRKVELRMNEQNKYEIIKKLVDTNGNKKRAATKLGCTVRTINRLIIKYKEQGKKGFMHGNRGRLPASAVPLDIKNEIISLYINDFSDANFTHFCEIVESDFGIKISDTTLNNWMRAEDVLSPKARRKTKKALKKKLKERIKDTASEKVKNELKETINIVDSSSNEAPIKYKDLKKINETNDIVFFTSNAGFKIYFEKKNASNEDIEKLHAFFDKQNIKWRKSIL